MLAVELIDRESRGVGASNAVIVREPRYSPFAHGGVSMTMMIMSRPHPGRMSSETLRHVAGWCWLSGHQSAG
jgi:hypothetical protein